MNISNLFDKVTVMNKFNADRRLSDRKKAAHHMAAGMGVMLMTGVCIAAVLLLTTKTGKEIREKMKNRAADTVDTLKYYVVKSADAAETAANHTANKANRVMDAAQDKAEGIKKEFIEGKDRVVKDIQATADDIANELKDRK